MTLFQQGVEFPQRHYQILMRSSTGPIDCYLIRYYSYCFYKLWNWNTILKCIFLVIMLVESEFELQQDLFFIKEEGSYATSFWCHKLSQLAFTFIFQNLKSKCWIQIIDLVHFHNRACSNKILELVKSIIYHRWTRYNHFFWHLVLV